MVRSIRPAAGGVSFDGCRIRRAEPAAAERRQTARRLDQQWDADIAAQGSSAVAGAVYFGPVEDSPFLIEEYKSVRQESLDALQRHQLVVQYGLAGTGVGTGLGLIAAEQSVAAAAVILMGLMPALIIFGIAMIGVESQRVVAARSHLRELEMRINETRADGDGPLLSWETKRVQMDPPLVNAFPIALAAAVGAALIIGPGIGGGLLATRELWLGFAVGVVIDIVALGAVAIAAGRRYRELLSVARVSSTEGR